MGLSLFQPGQPQLPHSLTQSGAVFCPHDLGVKDGAEHVALIAVVDTHSAFRAEVKQALISLYRVKGFANAETALREMRLELPSVILIDEMVEPRGGYEFIYELNRDPILSPIPTIITSLREPSSIAGALRQCGADTSLTKPFRRSSLIKAVTSLVNKGVEANWNSLPEHDRVALKGTVEVFNKISDFIATGTPIPFGFVQEACAPLIKAIARNNYKGILDGVKDHDNYSFAHSLRVATLLCLFGHTLGLAQEDQLILATGGLLHDAGKISIPHEVLNMHGPLSDADFEVMKTHVPETIKILSISPNIPKPVILIAAQHHEKLDGSGYPKGLKGDELNDLARMASIVDVFSALTDRRVYKPPMAAETAMSVMTDQMGHHLDQHFITLFKTMLLNTGAC
jgi:HD-GYP domain-containing protein (c-di-GMP phosphodiesterase class II)